MKRIATFCLALFSVGVFSADVFGQVGDSRATGAGRTGARSVRLSGSAPPSRSTRISTTGRHLSTNRSTDRSTVNTSTLSRDAQRIKTYEGKMNRHHADLQKFASENGIQLDVVRGSKQNNEMIKSLLNSQQQLQNSSNAAKAHAIESLLNKINEMRGVKQEQLQDKREHWQTKKQNAQEHWQAKKENWQTKKSSAQEHWQTKKENAQSHWQNKTSSPQFRSNVPSSQQSRARQGYGHSSHGQKGSAQNRSQRHGTQLNRNPSQSGGSSRNQAAKRGGTAGTKIQARPASNRSR